LLWCCGACCLEPVLGDAEVFLCGGSQEVVASGLPQSIPFARYNDDFCDCDDGSDEPGTSACAGVQVLDRPSFLCENGGAALPPARAC